MPTQHPISRIEHPPAGPWSALESARGLLSVPACWRERLGEHYEAFRAAFLSQSSQPARYYQCPRGCGCMHEVLKIPNSNPDKRHRDLGGIQHPEKHQGLKETPNTKLQAPEKLQIPSSNQEALGNFELGASMEPGAWCLELNHPSEQSTINHKPSTLIAVCRCPEPHCPDIPLTSADAVLLELSWTKLARAVCRALNLDSRPLDLGLLNTRQIGSWSAAAVPVILTIQTDHAWFRGVVLELITRLRGRFILLAPTSAHFDVVSQELIEDANAGFFPLEGYLLLLPSGMLQATKTPGELFARFTPDPRLEPGEDVARQAFALVEQLDTGGKPPSPLAVFRLYCMEGLSANRIARRLRCSKPTVLRRLKLIEQRVGVAPEKLRCYSGQFEEMEQADHRARCVYRSP